jgi:glucose/mannose-6-phosphate isomerase
MTDMKTLIEEFPQHLEMALREGDRTAYKVSGKQFSHVVISGLGGSGIGGRIVALLNGNSCPVPIFCTSDYTLPAFVNHESLVIISSYSGDTEETVASMNAALDRGAEVVCITSGGLVLKTAKTRGLNHYQVPPGNPPRSMLGFSLVYLHFIMYREGLIGNDFIARFKAAIDLIRNKRVDIEDEAGLLSAALAGRVLVLYAGAAYEALLVRWRQQINENSKMLCWHHVFPEMNHNELVGWTGGDNRFAVVLIHNSDDHERTKLRMDICDKLIREKCDTVIDVHSIGSSALERVVYLIHLGDHLSLKLAELGNVDPVAIPAINFLKEELSRRP